MYNPQNKGYQVLLIFITIFFCVGAAQQTQPPTQGNSSIEFKSINVDLPANSHYVKDYKLYTKSVIVSDMVQGKEQRWKNLQKVWELLHSEKEFKAYVKRETAAYLQGKHS